MRMYHILTLLLCMREIDNIFGIVFKLHLLWCCSFSCSRRGDEIWILSKILNETTTRTIICIIIYGYRKKKTNY